MLMMNRTYGSPVWTAVDKLRYKGRHPYEKNIRFIAGNRLYFCRIRMQKRQHYDRNINTHQQLHSVRSNIIYQQSKHEWLVWTRYYGYVYTSQKSDWQYIDCVLTPDYASDRIGAVLFWDDAKGTSSVAFFDADGYYQQCGVYAKISSDPDFTYLGDGSVTYKLEKEDGAAYNCTLAISIDGDNVQFKVETDPLTQK